MCDNCCTPFIEGEGCNSALQKKASNVASGDYSLATGHGTIASNEGELSSGKYNKPNEGQLFSVGVGTSDSNRRNAMQVNADGSTSFLYNGNAVKLTDLISLIGGGGSGSGTIYMRVNNGWIEYSNDGVTWTRLISKAELQGPAGAPGAQGPAGQNADLNDLQLRIADNMLSISRDGGNSYTIVGQVGGEGGSGGVTPLLRVYDGYIEVSYNNGTTYQRLLSLESITGPAGAKGEKGDPGSDGVSAYSTYRSIVFRRNRTKPNKPEGGSYTDPIPPGWSDGIPGGEEILWMSSRWFSNNESLDVLYEWSEPVQATDTADIDFEYSAVDSPGTPSSNPSNWHNAGVTTDKWMAVRIKKNGYWGEWSIMKIKGENGLNGQDGRDGISPSAHFKSIVFMRSNTTPARPADSAGSYEEPVPDGWSDGIPSGNGKIWTTSRMFSTDPSESDEHWADPEIISDGLNGYDYEWCDEETLPAGFPYPSRTSPDDANPGKDPDDIYWYDDPTEIESADPVWMAMRKYDGGVYTQDSWIVIKIKGEDGTDGTSVTPRGSIFGTFDSLDAAQTYYDSHPGLKNVDYAIAKGTNSSVYNKLYKFTRGAQTSTYTDETSTLSVGDFYLDPNGNMWVWDQDNFVNAGVIRGPQGQPGPAGQGAYLHIKYSNSPNGNPFTYNPATESYDGTVPGDYIGMYWDNNPTSATTPSTYAPWRYWRGQDGFGYEYIFTLTDDDEAPHVPTTSEDVDDYVPDGWSDDLLEPSLAHPYCWVCWRKKVDGHWQAYKGQANNTDYAALYSRFVRDGSHGRGIDHVAEFYAISTNGVAPTVTDPTTGYPYTNEAPDLSSVTVKTWLWNFERTYWDSGDTPYTDTPIVAIGVSIPGKGIAQIREYYYASAYKEQHDGQDPYPPVIPNPPTGGTGQWKASPQFVNADYPYLWNYEVVWYSDGTYDVTTPVIIAYYTYTDIEYIKSLFEKVSDSYDAILTGYLGIYDENRDIVAMINGGDDIHATSDTHGKIMIASGMTDGIQPSGIDGATFQVYEDGHVVAHDLVATGADISGRITAGSGSIGPLVINQDYLHGDYVNTDTGAESSINMSPSDFSVSNKRPVAGTGGRVNSTGVFDIADDNQHGFVEITYDRQSTSHPEPALYVSATNSATALEVNGNVVINGTISAGLSKIRYSKPIVRVNYASYNCLAEDSGTTYLLTGGGANANVYLPNISSSQYSSDIGNGVFYDFLVQDNAVNDKVLNVAPNSGNKIISIQSGSVSQNNVRWTLRNGTYYHVFFSGGDWYVIRLCD